MWKTEAKHHHFQLCNKDETDEEEAEDEEEEKKGKGNCGNFIWFEIEAIAETLKCCYSWNCSWGFIESSRIDIRKFEK